MSTLASPASALPRRIGWRLGELVLPAILLLALALRCLAATVPSVHHPDEIYQYMEAAHRLVFGYGIVPWEYQWGIRNWLFPLILAVPMQLGEWLSPGGTLYLTLPHALMIALSMTVPWSAWALGERTSRTHAVMAAFVAATWSETVYFAPHTLSENLAIAALMPAAALLSDPNGIQRKRGIAAGALLAFACFARFQLGPSALILAAYACRMDWRRWAMLAIGGAAMLLVGAAVDLATGTMPFAWLLENIRQNIGEDRASQYGTLGPLGYVTWFEYMWSWWLIAIVPAVWLGARRQPALFWAAIANIVLLSFVAHKEYRFIEFSAVALIVLAGIGTVDAVAKLRMHWPRISQRRFLAGAALLWLAGSGSIVAGAGMQRNIGHGDASLAIVDALRRDSQLCGVAILSSFVEWGGYASLHRTVPVSYFDPNDPALHGMTRQQAAGRWAHTFNRVIGADMPDVALPAGYHRGRCVTSIAGGAPTCIYERSESCTADAANPFVIQQVFERDDQLIRARVRRSRERS